MRAIGEMTGTRGDRSGVAFAVLLVGLLAASGAAVSLLDDLYLKPYARQAEWGSLRDQALRAEQASQGHLQDELAGLAGACSEWAGAAGLGGAPGRSGPPERPGGWVPEDPAGKNVDAAWLTDASGGVVGVWTRTPASTGTSIFDPVQLRGLWDDLAPAAGQVSTGLCKLGGKLSFFACKDLGGGTDLAGRLWVARTVGAERLAKWGSAVGGNVKFADPRQGPRGVLFDEGGRPMFQLTPDRRLVLQWPLHGAGGNILGLLTCEMHPSPRQASAEGFRGAMLAVLCLCLGLGILSIAGSYAWVTRPLARFLLRLRRLRTGEGTLDLLTAGLRGPTLLLAEELGRAMTGLAQDCRADPMTGLANRRHFQEALEAFYSQASRHDRPLSIMVMDVDHFKQVNDTLGHLQGDDVIRGVARVIGSSLRGADLAARLGGDEFAVILPDTDANQAAEVAERIRQKTLAIKPPASRGGGISMSIGVADLQSGPVACCKDLIELADRSLYAVKARGRNKVLLAHTLHGHLQFSELQPVAGAGS